MYVKKTILDKSFWIFVLASISMYAPAQSASSCSTTKEKRTSHDRKRTEFVSSGLWIFSGDDGHIKAGPGDRMVKLSIGDRLFNANIGSGAAPITDATGKFILQPNAIASLDVDNDTMIGFFVEQGEVEATENYPLVRSAPRKRRQRTTKSVSVSPGGTKIVPARSQAGNWARYSVHKDLLNDIVQTRVTCREGKVAVTKDGYPKCVLKHGMSCTITE